MVYLSKMRKEKTDQIMGWVNQFNNQHSSDVEKLQAVEELRRLALTEHGLVDTKHRKAVWPILLNV